MHSISCLYQTRLVSQFSLVLAIKRLICEVTYPMFSYLIFWAVIEMQFIKVGWQDDNGRSLVKIPNRQQVGWIRCMYWQWETSNKVVCFTCTLGQYNYTCFVSIFHWQQGFLCRTDRLCRINFMSLNKDLFPFCKTSIQFSKQMSWTIFF